MQDEVNTKVVAIMIKGGKISAEVLKKALDKFVQEIEKAQKLSLIHIWTLFPKSKVCSENTDNSAERRMARMKIFCLKGVPP